jgi:hypothetical protein
VREHTEYCDHHRRTSPVSNGRCFCGADDFNAGFAAGRKAGLKEWCEKVALPLETLVGSDADERIHVISPFLRKLLREAVEFIRTEVRALATPPEPTKGAKP